MASLHSYQRRAVADVLLRPHSFLMLDVGLGKSAVALTALREMIDSGELVSALVIAPKKVAEHTWPAEQRLWAEGLGMSLIVGSPAERTKAAMSPAPLHVIGIDNVPWLIEQFGKRWPYNVLIVDESQRLKDPSSKRFKSLRKVRHHFDRVILMSATPASESLLGLWSQVFLADGGERLGKSYTAFKNAFWDADYMGWNLTLRPGAENAIHARLDGMVTAMRAEDYLDLPERIENVIPVDIDLKQYRQLERDYLLPEPEITAANAAVLTGKLLQLTSGAVYDEHKTPQVLHDAKIEALKELIDAANGQPVLVFYWFKHEAERIKRAIKAAEDLDVERWNAKRQPVALAHPASAGAGLNLQHGGSVIVWMTTPWSLELYTQANGRLHRQGQKNTVIVHHLVASGTIDEDVLAALGDKQTGQDRLINALKGRL